MRNKKYVKQKKEGHCFYEVLQVLYYFFEQECKGEKGVRLKYFNDVKKRITQLAADLGNSAYLDNWYDISSIRRELKDLVVEDKTKEWYIAKEDI